MTNIILSENKKVLDIDDKIFDYLNAIIIIARSNKETDTLRAIKTIATDASNYLCNTYVSEKK